MEKDKKGKNQPLANRVNVLRSSPPPFKQDIWHNEKRRWEISWLIKPELVGHLSLLCVEALITNTHEARAIAMFKLLSWHQVVWFETMVKPLYLMQGIFRQSHHVLYRLAFINTFLFVSEILRSIWVLRLIWKNRFEIFRHFSREEGKCFLKNNLSLQ